MTNKTNDRQTGMNLSKDLAEEYTRPVVALARMSDGSLERVDIAGPEAGGRAN